MSAQPVAIPRKRLDQDGRCCGALPMAIRRAPRRFNCVRCYAEFDAEGRQIPNWAWRELPGGDFETTQAHARAKAAPL